MADQSREDDDLLADAIPIDELELDEDEDSDLPQSSSGGGGDEDDPIDLVDTGDAEDAPSQIQTFGAHEKHEEKWNRSPNTTGTGAIHVKTFVAKLRLDAVEHLDEQINEWLDNHPEYEVKFVTTTIGDLRGKTLEPAMFMSVWV